MEIVIETEKRIEQGIEERRYEITPKKKGLIQRFAEILFGRKEEDTLLLHGIYEHIKKEDGTWIPAEPLKIRKWPEEISRVTINKNTGEIEFWPKGVGYSLKLKDLSKIKIVILPERTLSKRRA